MIRSFTAQTSRVNAPLYCSGAHSAASCLCVLSSCAVFCIDPRVVVVQQLMQQGAGAGGSDVFVGQILNIVLSELCALHSGQMLKQLSHVATLVLLQQHQYNLQKQQVIIYHPAAGRIGQITYKTYK